jgi:hypothetical protein
VIATVQFHIAFLKARSSNLATTNFHLLLLTVTLDQVLLFTRLTVSLMAILLARMIEAS